MSFNQVRADRPYRVRGRSTTGLPHSTGLAAVSFTGANLVIDSYATSGRIDSGPGSWNLGTGVPIDTNGSVIFDSNINGGSLVQVTLANRFGNNAYIGFNKGNPAIGSGVLLASGESIQYDNTVITKIWAIATSNIAGIQGNGLYYNDIIKAG